MSSMDDIVSDLRRITFGHEIKDVAPLDLVNLGYARELTGGRLELTLKGAKLLDLQFFGPLVIAGIVDEESGEP